MDNPYPDLDGHPDFPPKREGAKKPPKECGPPLMAGYTVQPPAEFIPSHSPSCFVKIKGPELHDVGKRVTIPRKDDDSK